MNILLNRIPVRKDSPVHIASLDWRKNILVAFQFFAFLHSLDPFRHFVTVNCRIAKALFEDLVGDGEQRLRNSEAEGLGGLCIDREIELGRLLNRQFGRLGAF
jgi:hypothetical protein